MQNNKKAPNERPIVPMHPGRGPGGPMGARINREKPKNIKKTLFRLLAYLGKSKLELILLLSAVIVTALLTLAGPALQGEAINIIAGQSNRKLIPLLLFMLLVYVVLSLVTYLQGRLSAHLSQKTVYNLRKDLFEKISRLSIKYTDTHPHGDIMSRMTNDVDNISTAVSCVVTLVGAISLMLFYSPFMTLISFITIPLSMFVSSQLAKKMRKYFVRRQVVTGQLNAHVEEMVTGYKTVMAFGKERASVEQFKEISEELSRCGIKANISGGVMGPLMNVIGNLGYVLVAITGGFLALGQLNPAAAEKIAVIGPFLVANAVSVGTIQTIVGYTKSVTRPVNEIANQYAQILTAVAGAERVFTIMDEEPETDNGQEKCADMKGSIDFCHVDFSYLDGHPVLTDFDLHVKAGEKIALVGATGSGKTTVVNLLMRFYEINGGAIKIDGVDIRDIQKKELRQSMAIVLQDTVLFSDTIASNICYGREGATEEDIAFAASVSGADRFISRLPMKYETLLSEQGSNLSQGQRQLLAITRAVVADPKILILDEATSNIDTRSEMQIQSALLKLMENRTSIVIAHRLSTIRDADRIVVIRAGRIIEIGNHEELLSQNGEYAKLYNSQFAGFAT